MPPFISQILLYNKAAWSEYNIKVKLIPSPHLPVLVTSERFLLAWGIFRAILASESHWLPPMLILFVYWSLAPAGVGSVLVGPLHTRDREPMTITLQALSLVGKAVQGQASHYA
jgi:hypothetical protein